PSTSATCCRAPRRCSSPSISAIESADIWAARWRDSSSSCPDTSRSRRWRGSPAGAIDWITVVLGLAAFATLTLWKGRLNVVVVVLGGGLLGLLRALYPAAFGGPITF